MTIECRPSLLPGGNESIAWIAEHLRSPWLDPFVAKFSQLGETGAVMLMLAVAYWFWNKRHAKFLSYGMFAALLLNILLKGWVMECRPPAEYWLEKIRPGSYSFPSGHAQVCILLWVGLGYFLRSKWQSVLCVAIGILVALSRPYQGVHYIHDVVAGMLIGLGILMLCIFFDKEQWQPFKRIPLWVGAMIFLLILTGYSLLVNDPSGLSIVATASCFGSWLGYQWEQRVCGFIPATRPITICVQLLIGCVGILVLWKGVDHWRGTLPLSAAISVHYFQYFLIGLWISFGAPFVFTRYKLTFLQRKDLPVPS